MRNALRELVLFRETASFMCFGVWGILSSCVRIPQTSKILGRQFELAMTSG